MKKTEIAMIVLIASTSVMIAYFVASSIFGGYYTGNAKVKTIDSISDSIEEPSGEIFNKDAINPTVRVHISGTGSDGTSE